MWVDEALKHVKSNTNNWISCRERVPKDESQEYIVCCSGTDGKIKYHHAVVTNTYFEDGKWYINGAYKKDVVVHAWQPLPYPYKGE